MTHEPSDLSSGTLDPPSRVRWHCRRGMLELDLLLLRFFNARYATLSDTDKKNLSNLTNLPRSHFVCLVNGASRARSQSISRYG